MKFQAHLQYPQIKRNVINSVKLPPQFPYYGHKKKTQGETKNVHLNSNQNGFRVKNYNSKIGYGNGVDLEKPSLPSYKKKGHVLELTKNSYPKLGYDGETDSTNLSFVSYKFHPQTDSTLTNITPDKELGVSKLSKDSMLSYVTRKLIKGGLSQVNDLVFDGKRQDEELAEALSNAIINDVPGLVTADLPDIYSLKDLIKSLRTREKTEATRIPPKPHVKFDLKSSASGKYGIKEVNHNQVQYLPDHFNKRFPHNTVYDATTTLIPSYLDNKHIDAKQQSPLLVSSEIGTKNVPSTQQSSLLNRLTTEGLKIALKQVNNLVFDGKRQDEKLAETLSSAIIHGIPNLLTPEIPKLHEIFRNPFAASDDTEAVKKLNSPEDLNPSASNALTTSSTQTTEDSSLRYIFLLGFVPTIVGSFLALGAQPLQAMLVGAYVVTTYLFFVEKSWASQRSERKTLRVNDPSNERQKIELIFSKAINKFLNVSKSLPFEEDSFTNSEEAEQNVKKVEVSDLMINEYFDYSEQFKPLFGLMDHQTISYVKRFDEIVSEMLASI